MKFSKWLCVGLAIALLAGPLCSISSARGHRLKKLRQGVAKVIPGDRCCRR
jgi:hypothetical protein